MHAHSEKGIVMLTSGLCEFQVSEHSQEPLAMSKLVQLLITQFLVKHFCILGQQFENTIAMH